MKRMRKVYRDSRHLGIRYLGWVLVCMLNLHLLSAQEYQSAPRSNAGEVDWKLVEQMSEEALYKEIREQIIFPEWMKNAPVLTYYRDSLHWMVDARKGKEELLIQDVLSFRTQYYQLTQDSLDADFRLFSLKTKDDDPNTFYFERKGKAFTFHRKKNLLELCEPEEKKRTYTIDTFHSPDSAYSVLGCGYDLYIRNNADGSVDRMTFDGKEDASFTYRNSKDTIERNSSGFWLGHKFISVLQDRSQILEMGLINSLTSGRPKLNTFKMPMPGDVGVKQTRIWWYDADAGQGRYLDIDKYADQEVDLNFFRSDSVLFFTRKSRKGDYLDLCKIDVARGEVKEIISEYCPPHFNRSLFAYRLIEGGKQILWWSERTGKGNYYLYDGNGRLLNRVTQGENLVAAEVVRLDEKKRSLVFKGYGQEGGNPYYAYYYRVSLNGRKQQLLTPGEGTHNLSLSEDGRYAFDQMSRMDLPPVYRVLSVDRPKNVYTFAQVSDSALRAKGWQPPVLLRILAADKKTDLYGLMYLPLDITIEDLKDSVRLSELPKYPIITNVYPGPHDDQIPRSFVLDDNGNQSLAAMGFVVINIGSRGSSPLRGREFYTYGYGNLRDYALADCKYVIEELAEKYSFIDLNRVGIYGHSGGGFQTVAAMLTDPDFYKVGVAASGNHDNNIYIQWWGETFHGVEELKDTVSGKSKFVCKVPTNMELAGNLKGRLLLITGDIDKNVPPSNTYRMADALIRKNKRFDMFVLPGKDHGVMCPYYLNQVRYYFLEHLKDPKPFDIDIVKHLTN